MSDLVEVKTIGEVERVVHASGLWDGTGPVEFSDDGTVWVEAWAPTPDPEHEGMFLTGHPTYARVEVYRKDVRIPTKVTIRWDEQVPAASEEWSAKWFASPMRHFGRTARMVGFRQTFRDLLGDIVIEDEADTRSGATAPLEKTQKKQASKLSPEEFEAWKALFLSARSVQEIEAIAAEARSQKVFSPTKEGTDLDRLWKNLRDQMQLNGTVDEWTPAPSASADAQGTATVDLMQNLADSIVRHHSTPELTADELDRHHAFFDDSDEVRPVIRNRADRRAEERKRKKGRR